MNLSMRALKNGNWSIDGGRGQVGIASVNGRRFRLIYFNDKQNTFTRRDVESWLARRRP